MLPPEVARRAANVMRNIVNVMDKRCDDLSSQLRNATQCVERLNVILDVVTENLVNEW